MSEIPHGHDQDTAESLAQLAAVVGSFESADLQAHFTESYDPSNYPVLERELHTIVDARQLATEAPASDATTAYVHVVGRVQSQRMHRNFAFLVVGDDSGNQIQLIMPRARHPEAADTTESFLRESKAGDVVVASGMPTLSRTGEPSILASHETQRLAPAYISGDKIGHNPAADERAQRIVRFQQRATMKRTIRQVLETSGFTEVVTPTLTAVASGANAEVFTSDINALNQTGYLRISPELSLKTAIVQGLSDRVYEIATNFRNEGIDREHSPEFEMLEFYAAYMTAETLRDYTARLIGSAALASLGTTAVTLELANGSSRAVDLAAWNTVSYPDVIQAATGLSLDAVLALPESRQRIQLLEFIARSRGTAEAYASAQLGAGSLIDKIFKFHCRPEILDPTFVERYPAVMAPLARPNDDDPRFVDMFQAVVGSMELAKGYQELTDPVKQLRNLRTQAAAKAAGDSEAMSIDWSYLKTLLQGLPPTAGCGIGMDRLAAVLAGTKNIHATMPFPFRERFSAQT